MSADHADSAGSVMPKTPQAAQRPFQPKARHQSATPGIPVKEAKMYYDFLTNEQKDVLRNILSQGPQLASEGVSPNATDNQRMAIGKKRFKYKFHRDPFEFAMNHFSEGVSYDRRTIAQRLDDDLADGYADRQSQTSGIPK
jgi:hypothetical protein